MRLATFYLRSRIAGYALAVLVASGLLEWAGARMLLAPTWATPESSLVPVLLFAPLVAACIAGASTRSPFGEIEQTSSYPLPILRLCHLAGLLTCSSLLLAAPAGGWELPHAELIVVRNVLGLSGVSFIASWAFGSGLSWTLPLAYVAVVQTTGRSLDGEWARWAWPAQPITDIGSSSVAITLLLAGLFAVCFFQSNRLLANA